MAAGAVDSDASKGTKFCTSSALAGCVDECCLSDAVGFATASAEDYTTYFTHQQKKNKIMFYTQARCIEMTKNRLSTDPTRQRVVRGRNELDRHTCIL